MYGSRMDVVARLQRIEPEDLDAPCRRRSSVERAPKLFGMRHRLRFKQLGARSRPRPRSVRVGCAGRSGARPPGVGPPTRRAYAAKPSSRNGSQILGVRVEHVLAPDLARGVEEREAHADRDLEQRALLAVGLGEEALVDGGELRRRGEALRVVAQVGERALQPLDLERWDVDQPCSRPARSLERGEQVVDRRELRLSREDAGRLELADERVEVDASPVRDVRCGGEEPERREPEREDRPELDDVAAGLADGELLRRGLDLVGDGLGRHARLRRRARR